MLLLQVIVLLFAVFYCTESIPPQFHRIQVLTKRSDVGTKSNNVEDSNLNHSIPSINITKLDNAELRPTPNRSSTNNVKDHKSSSSLSSNKSQSPNVEVQPRAGGKLEEKTFEFEPGAITRGILVLVGLSFLFILYVGFRTYKMKKRDKRRTLLRKYGVRTRKSDVEMEPLPLSDDDEDETLFDLTVNGSLHH